MAAALDIWRLRLDGGSFERLTTFDRWAPYYASTRRSRPTGRRWPSSCRSTVRSRAGADGILLMDLEA